MQRLRAGFDVIRIDVQKAALVSALKNNLAPSRALADDRQPLLAQLVEGLTPAQLYDLAARIAQLAVEQGSVPLGVSLHAAPASARLTVIYGSQTGNAKRLAEQLVAQAQAAGLPARLVRADAYATRELAHEKFLAVVISTQGDGDPPDDARALMDFLASRRAPTLDDLAYSVLALGDSSYPKYCEIGRQVDARLAALGARRLAPLAEADVDFEDVAQGWQTQSVQALQQKLPAADRTHGSFATITPLRAVESRHGREQPFAAAVLGNQRIVSRDADRAVRHIELSLAGSGLRYQPGDALGVWHRNPRSLVDAVLELHALRGDAPVTVKDQTRPLIEWLSTHRELTRLSRPLIQAQATRTGNVEMARLLEPEQREAFAALLQSHQPIDLLRRWPADWDAEGLVSALRPLTPRSYSIASSLDYLGADEVHLTVAAIDYEAHGSRHVGAASDFLCSADEDAEVDVFIEPNERFRLPADASRDVLMIGPGTGVAPFRAFVQQREIDGGSGRNWLLFGNRHHREDFLYQREWQDALTRGALHRLTVAFSRDQQDKRYVQHVLAEQGAEVYAWLRNGAHLYVCGDASQMARDVDAALVAIVAQHGHQSADQAQTWLADLMQQGRYARDVY